MANTKIEWTVKITVGIPEERVREIMQENGYEPLFYGAISEMLKPTLLHLEENDDITGFETLELEYENWPEEPKYIVCNNCAGHIHAGETIIQATYDDDLNWCCTECLTSWMDENGVDEISTQTSELQFAEGVSDVE